MSGYGGGTNKPLFYVSGLPTPRNSYDAYAYKYQSGGSIAVYSISSIGSGIEYGHASVSNPFKVYFCYLI